MFDLVAEEAVELVEKVGRTIAGLDAAAGSDTDLCAAAVALSRLSSLVAAGQAAVLAELDARGVCDREFGLTTASWLAREATLPSGVARQQVNTAAKLRTDLPETHDALTAGRITSHHARVLAQACTPRIAEGLAALQPELIGLAGVTSFDRWRAEVRGIVEMLDEDGPHDPNADLARNKLTLAETIDGITHLAGQFVGDHALAVREAIETRADDLFRRFGADHERCPDITVPNRATLRALALAELIRAGNAVDTASTRPPRPEVTLVIRADEPDADGPTTHTEADRRPGQPTGSTSEWPVPPVSAVPRRARVHRPDGTRLPEGTTRTLCCDPDLFALVVDSLGVPLDMGRRVRLATTAQRRAIAARDGGCCFPGCDLPLHWCDQHHIDPYETGGETNVERLAPLCRRHHGVTHRSGWRMEATQDGWFHWTTPSGHRFWSQRHGRQRTGPVPDGDVGEHPDAAAA
jgi:hypothetical protein